MSSGPSRDELLLRIDCLDHEIKRRREDIFASSTRNIRELGHIGFPIALGKYFVLLPCSFFAVCVRNPRAVFVAWPFALVASVKALPQGSGIVPLIAVVIFHLVCAFVYLPYVSVHQVAQEKAQKTVSPLLASRASLHRQHLDVCGFTPAGTEGGASRDADAGGEN